MASAGEIRIVDATMDEFLAMMFALASKLIGTLYTFLEILYSSNASSASSNATDASYAANVHSRKHYVHSSTPYPQYLYELSDVVDHEGSCKSNPWSVLPLLLAHSRRLAGNVQKYRTTQLSAIFLISAFAIFSASLKKNFSQRKYSPQLSLSLSLSTL